MSYDEFSRLARQGYPMNELLKMAGADYDYPAQCTRCGKKFHINTGDDDRHRYMRFPNEACSADCDRALADAWAESGGTARQYGKEI